MMQSVLLIYILDAINQQAFFCHNEDKIKEQRMEITSESQFSSNFPAWH